jgi:lambda family phage tail tape measure protein
MAFNLGAKVAIDASVTGQANLDNLNRSIKQIGNSTNDLSSGVAKATTVLKGLAAAYVIREGAQFLKGIIDTADGLRDLSQKTGVGVQALSALKTAGELNGVAFDQLQVGLKKFGVNLVEASVDGAGKAASAFKALGINVKDATGQLKPSSAVIFELADKFKNLQDGPYKAALAVRIFGKSGSDLIPILNEGSEALRKYGLAISDDFANRADQFNDSLTILGVQIKNLAITGLSTLLPTLQEIAASFLKLTASGPDTIGFFDALGEGIRLLAILANAAVQGFLQMVDVFKTGGATAIDYLKTVSAQAKAVLTGNFNEAGRLRDEFAARTDKADEAYMLRTIGRANKISTYTASLTKNSLLFGKGTDAEIRARQAEATAPTPRKKGAGVIDPNSLDLKAASQEEAGKKAADKRIIQINAETAALGQSDIQKKKTLELAKLEESGLKKNSAAYAEYSRKVLDAIDAQERHRKELQNDPFEGAKRALREYIDAASDLATQTQGVVALSLKGLEDQFVEFFTKGSFQWKQFANTIIAEIVRIAVKRAIIAPLAGLAASAFGFADGGVMTSRGPLELKSYASGGIASSPQLALFGEGRQPEAFVPLPDGRRIPVAMQGGGSGGSTNVSVTVNMQTGAQDTSASDARSQDLGKAVSQAVVAELIKQKRPGGLIK